MNTRRILAVSGVKNSGKTTLIDRMLPLLKEAGIRTCVIKHDGHDFVPDVPGTDSYKHLEAGAAGAVCYSDKRYMAVKQNVQADVSELISLFPEADLILIEGCKDSSFPKIEVVREGNSAECVCKGKNLLAVATDLEPSMVEGLGLSAEVRVLNLNVPEQAAAFVLGFLKEKQSESKLRMKSKLVLAGEDDFFGPGVARLFHLIDERGSISRAAAEMEMSYSKAWKQIGKVETETGIKFLERVNGGKNGGNSTLTEEGRRFVEQYDAMRETLRRWSDTLLEQYMRDYL